ncbi:MAG: hypothetical protein ACYS9X_04660 [Planctomycetota bacterium]|jgi:hypothetical protein
MGKKSGKAPKAVSPAAPEEVVEAAVADPGKAAEQKAAQQKAAESSSSAATDTSEMKPHKPPKEEEAPLADESGTDEAATQQASEEEQQGEEEEKKTSWIEIEMVGEDDEPIPGEKYRIILPDGETFADGTLDEKGFARVEGFEKGTCKVSFPDLDKEAWEKI